MTTGTVYLDIDDEITSAAQRIRGSETTKVALVVPGGSRIATSRMNFRLLSREAVVNNRRLSIVAADPATRALAASAGLPVFSSVSEYDAAVAPSPPIDDADRNGDGGDGNGGALAMAAGTAVPVAPAAAAAAVPAAPAAEPDEPRPKRRRATRAAPVSSEDTEVVALAPSPSLAQPVSQARVDAAATAPMRPPRAERLPVLARRRGFRVTAPVATVAALIALAVLVAGVGAFVFLPSAQITITPRAERIGPISLDVVADPDVDAADASVDPPVVPAVRLEIPLSVSDTFPTAGKRVTETAAKGEVTFRNLDFTATNTIADGSIVATQGGVRFKTDRAVTVPRARLVGLRIVPSEADVAVTAVKKGTAGNVDPNTITVIPAAEDPTTLSVRNKAETTGGTHEESPQVKQADVDKALEALQAKLPDALDEAIASGAGAPAGAQVFEQTAVVGDATPTVDPATIVGQEVESFELGLSAAATVIAVDSSPVEKIAESRLLSNVGTDHRLVDGSIKYDPGDPTVSNGEVRFPITAEAARVPLLDTAALLAKVKGQPIERARQILAEYGEVSIVTWPDWVSSIPGMDSRLELVVAGQDGQAGGSAPATTSPASSGTEP